MPSKKPVITIRVEPSEYEMLKEQADREFRSVPSLVLAIVKKTLSGWRVANQPEQQQSATPTPTGGSEITHQTFKELIRENYFPLLNAEKINPTRLKELSFGHKPNIAELSIIAHVLDIPEELVVELRDRTFPKSQSKPKQTNGHT